MQIGTKLGTYEVIAKLGEGGMGEVYRARDTQLGRDVAIKVLPDSFAGDADRLMRFEREARTLASLNHPHIAQVYGLQSSDRARAIVMELVEGEDLSERIGRGPIPLDESIAITRQIAEALEAAHDAGIVHRDLKPANVKVTPDGRVKVLDFGLSKALPDPYSSVGSAMTAAVTSPAMTHAGMIVGTAAYMSPEQARGKAVDRRADLWALGCVLYEMLTASRAFDGETMTDVLSGVVSKEPDWSKLPPGAPPAVQRLLRRCLRKDVRARLQSAGDARVELDEALAGSEVAAGPVASASRARLRWLSPLAFAALGAVIAAGALLLMWPRTAVTADPPVMRFAITVPPTLSSPGGPTISPDGRWIALTAIGPSGNYVIWLRPMDGQAFQPIAGTDMASNPIWSADSRELAFSAAVGALFRVAVTGGRPTRVADVPTPGGQQAWGTDGSILLSAAGRIHRVPASGGTLTPLTPEAGPNVIHAAPSWLPGNRFLFSEFVGGINLAQEGSGLFLQSLSGGAPTRLMDGRIVARHTPQGLLAARFTVTGVPMGTISAHRFDVERGTVEQPGVVLAVDADPFFSVSDTGVLVYRSASVGGDHRLQWVDSKGQPTGEGFDVSGAGAFNLSRDEHLVGFQQGNDIMLRDLTRGVTTRVVQGPGVLEPILSPDGRRVAFSRILPGMRGITIRSTAGGAEDAVFTSPEVTLVEDWSRDGRFLLGIQILGRQSPTRGLIIPLEPGRTPVVFADLPDGSALDEPRFSPDGNWIVYNAADSGRQQVYLVPVAPTGERWQLSTDGGSQGRWRSDGGAVFYLSASGQLMEVAVKASNQQPPQFGRPRLLFETGLDVTSTIDQYAPSADGTRFLLRRPRDAAGGLDLQVIVNWPTLLTRQ